MPTSALKNVPISPKHGMKELLSLRGDVGIAPYDFQNMDFFDALRGQANAWPLRGIEKL